MEQELLTFLEHPSSPQVVGGVRVTRSLALCVCFVDRCLSFCTLFFWLLCCLFFFNLRILIIPLVSSNSIYMCAIRWVSYKKNSLLTLREHLSSPAVFCGIYGAHLFIFQCYFVFCLSSLCVLCAQCCQCRGLFISNCLSVFYVCLTLPLFNDSACTKLGK